MWDPFSGDAQGIKDPSKIDFDFEPYESRLIFFSNGALTPASRQSREKSDRLDISHDWKVTFGDPKKPTEMQTLSSWGDDARLRYYSGNATYRRTIDISEDDLKAGHAVFLDFGEGVPIAKPDPLPRSNMRAYLEGPVREAALVYVNDKLTGYVWHPPFRLDVSHELKQGLNEVRIEVGNTAINGLAEGSMPTYRLLRDRYGVEFEPQDMKDLEPLPSGILGKLTLIKSGPDR
jgi:hypothetical protein